MLMVQSSFIIWLTVVFSLIHRIIRTLMFINTVINQDGMVKNIKLNSNFQVVPSEDKFNFDVSAEWNKGVNSDDAFKMKTELAANIISTQIK